VEVPAGTGISLVTSEDAGVPAEFVLGQNYPNPFNPETWIPFDLPVGGRVSIRVYDVLGREVGSPVDEVRPAGSYLERWSPGARLPSGVYLCRMTTGPFVAVRKMLLLR
jgi:hypothetical protein